MSTMTPTAPAVTVNVPGMNAATAEALKVTQGRVIKSEWLKFRTLRSSWVLLILGIGALAGLLAAAGATATGWVLATRAFELPYSFGAMAWVLGIAGGIALALLGGWLGLRPVMNEPPLRTLREA